MDESAVVGQEIVGDASKRWSFEQRDEKFDRLNGVDDGCFTAFGSGVSANEVIKSGPILISAKNSLGWYSWRRRWISLTKKAIIFFKRDPCIHAEHQVNIILGGILLKNSGSVQVREDKRLLTILFPDVLDRRPFTFKTETLEDLHEWRTAVEQCLRQGNAKISVKSPVASSSVLLALKEADGSPSLLEKALCFLEEFGAKVEGILRIAADMDEVQLRIQEFLLGNTEFDANEDAHVVADCVKYILRELPVSFVSVCCCQELVKAYETYQGEDRIIALRMAIYKKLPEPNRLLFQRILKMMYAISCTPENRMTPLAVAACMAPLLLRPILNGDCNLTIDTDFIGDDCSQLLGVAIAAKTAQAIIALILEEYHSIFSVENLFIYSTSVDSEDEHSNEDSIDENFEFSSSEDPIRISLGCDPYDEMENKISAESINLHGTEKQPENRRIDLQKNLREEAKVNVPLQRSLERKKQALIEQYLILNEHVEKLEGKLQTEDGFPFTAEVGLDQGMSSENFPNQEPLTRDEADDVRSGQEVGEAPHQLSLLQHLCGSSSDATDAYRFMQSATLESLLRNLDANLTFEETLDELSVQPNIKPIKAKSVRSSNIISSKIKSIPHMHSRGTSA